MVNQYTICLVLLALFAPSMAYEYTSQQGDDWTEGSCATGVEQSPIDFDTDDASKLDDLMDLTLNYNDFSGAEVSFTFPSDHAAKVSRLSGGSMGSMNAKILSNKTQYTFDLLQFHFHAGSEHTIDGKRYDLCMHMVHQTSTTGLARPYAVIGVLWKEGDSDPFLADLIERGEVDWSEMFGSKLEEYLAYEGGLTTPGCDEVVNWFIWPKVRTASQEQIDYIAGKIDINGADKSTYHLTYRNVKPVNARKLYYWDDMGDFEDFAGVLSLAIIALFSF